MTEPEQPPEIPLTPREPPAADIAGAIASTLHALANLRDADALETIGVACLQEYVPALRNTGGSGDQQRDGVGGGLVDNKVVLTASLEQKWAQKVKKDLAGIDRHGHRPEMVIAVTNRKTGPKTRTFLEQAAPSEHGYVLRVIDAPFLALRLLTPELLPIREEKLALAPPQQPVAVNRDAYVGRLANLGAPGHIIGREAELDGLVELLRDHVSVDVVGVGGIGKTRLALEAARRVGAARVLFLDHTSVLDVGQFGRDVAGGDELVLIIDNAHRREDLAQVVGLVSARRGPAKLVFVVRPGHDERVRQAVEGTAFASADGVARLELGSLSDAAIAELIRAAKPAIGFEGAVEHITGLAAGNPLIALLAHHVAVTQGGIHGTARNDLLADYAQSALLTVISRRNDISADDLHDALAVIAALGRFGAEEESLAAALLELNVRTIRHRRDDLADGGLIAASGEAYAIVPDLLAAQIISQSFLSGRQSAGITYQELWDAAGEQRQDAMCSALGNLNGFVIEDSGGVGAVVETSLRALAMKHPARALNRAQSLAPGLPYVAAGIVDAALAALAGDLDSAEPQLLTAMEVLSRVPEPEVGWPRQLSVATAFFAGDRSKSATKQIQAALTSVYNRVPINTSVYDGQILTHVQDVLNRETAAFWAEHQDQSGCARTVAIASGQLLAVVAEHSYLSIADENTIKMGAGFLPAGEQTAKTLRTGARLLCETLPLLPLATHGPIIDALAELRRVGGGYAGPFGAVPSAELVTLAGEVLDETATALAAETELPLPTRARLVEILSEDPWPDDHELRSYRELLGDDPRDFEADPTGQQRAERQAATLLESSNAAVQLRRWHAWLCAATEAGTRFEREVVDQALAIAAQRDGDRIARAFAVVLPDGGPLAQSSAGALAELFLALTVKRWRKSSSKTLRAPHAPPWPLP